MNAKRLQRLQEIAKAKGLQYFSEDFSVSSNQVEVEIFEKEKLVESFDASKITARGIIRNIPISIYGRNRNGRKYKRELFLNLIKRGMFNRGNCLANHAGDGSPGENPPASVLSIGGIWHNLRADDDYPRADLYAVGPTGQLMLEILSAGGRLFFSLSGYGVVLEDGETVDPLTYETADEESVCDWIFMPSAGREAVATKENNPVEFPTSKKVNMDTILTESQNKIEEQTGQTTGHDVTSSVTSLKDTTSIPDRMQESQKTNTDTSENAVVDTAILLEKKMSEVNEQKMQEAVSAANESIRLQEKNLKHQSELAIKEALKNANRAEALEKLSAVADLISDRPAFQETLVKVKDAQTKIQEKLETELKEKDATIAKTQESVTEVSAKLAKLEESHKALQLKYATAAKVVDNMKKSGGKGLKEAVAKLASTKKDFKEALADIAAFKEERKNFIATIKKMKEEEGEEWEEPEEGSPYLGEEGIEKDTQVTEEEEVPADEDMDFIEAEGDEDELDVSVDDVDMGDEEEITEEDEEGTLDSDEEEVEPYIFDDEGEMSEAEENDDDDDGDAMDDNDPEDEDEEMEEAVIRESVKRKMAALKKSKVAKKGKMSVKEAAKLAATPKRKAVSSKMNKDVVAFYKEAVKVNPSIKDIKNSVLKSKSIKEAYAKVSAFTNKGESGKSHRMKESTNVRTWTKNDGSMW